jgi:hypothetical protein
MHRLSRFGHPVRLTGRRLSDKDPWTAAGRSAIPRCQRGVDTTRLKGLGGKLFLQLGSTGY